ncbi:MAG: aspartate kinase [Verrucomicrobiia bacterium]
MALIVQKYGGTSVGDIDRIRHVAKRVLATQSEGNELVVVVSAMSGVTDRLLRWAGELNEKPAEREVDMLLATGEQTTIALLAIAIEGLGGRAVSLTGAQAGIVTDGVHTRARIANITPDEIHRFLGEGRIVIVAGFQGRTQAGQITTLGRGGSDLTAIALAGALGASICQIYTDVDGVYTCDPRIVPNAKKLAEVSYDEMLELASAGAKVMQSRAVEFGKKFGVTFEVKSSFHSGEGTIVKEETPNMEQVVIRGVSVERKQAKITLTKLPDQPGVAARIFKAIAGAGVVVDMIVQNVSTDGSTDLSFTLNEAELAPAKETLGPILTELGAEDLIARGGIAKLSVVGIGMRSHSGVAAQLFDILSSAGINIQMISTSEIKIAVVVEESEIEKAARAAHDGFGLGKA